MSNFFIFIIVALVIILGLGHLVVFKVAVSIFGIQSSSLLIALRIIFVLLAVSFIAASIIASNYNNIFSRLFYTISAGWLAYLWYFFLAACIYGIVMGIVHFAGFDNSTSVGGGVGPSIFGIILFVAAFIIGTYGLIHAGKITVTNLDMTLPNLPAAWRGKTAVWVSDFHLGQVHGAAFADKVVKAINKLGSSGASGPDIVFIGGDLYDGVKVNEAEIIAPLANLRPPLGTYFITGNHEEYGDRSGFIETVKALGIRVLNDEAVNVNGLQIIGVDDDDSTNRAVFQEIMDKITINPQAASILLKHQPNLLDVPEKKGISLVLSGHTHRSQVFPLSLLPQLVYRKFAFGLNELGNMKIYTSSGVGTWGPPIRVGTDAEIVVVHFL